jgi:predicted metal-dependent hydrolase
MQKMVVRNGEVFEYTIKRISQSRGVKIIVHYKGNVEVVASKRVPEQAVEAFVMTKAIWVLRSIKRQLRTQRVVLHDNTEDSWFIHKDKAYMVAVERLAYFNQMYGFSWNTVTIKKTKSRWGSCSTKGNLAFNYKIALLPAELADYIIVHELCHLSEMNHGANFWKLVEKTVPDYRELRKQLKLFI